MEIQAKSGLRNGRKLVLAVPKSGKESKEAYMPESLATKLAGMDIVEVTAHDVY